MDFAAGEVDLFGQCVSQCIERLVDQFCAIVERHDGHLRNGPVSQCLLRQAGADLYTFRLFRELDAALCHLRFNEEEIGLLLIKSQGDPEAVAAHDEALLADAADDWWDDAWPYRIPVTVSGSGVAQVSIDFTTAFKTLGLNGALLDVRSLRVVPYNGVTPGAPLAHDETYCTMLEDADSPQIDWAASVARYAR